MYPVTFSGGFGFVTGLFTLLTVRSHFLMLVVCWPVPGLFVRMPMHLWLLPMQLPSEPVLTGNKPVLVIDEGVVVLNLLVLGLSVLLLTLGIGIKDFSLCLLM